MDCARCLKPAEDEIHGSVENCTECKVHPGEERAHHKFENVEPALADARLFHALVN